METITTVTVDYTHNTVTVLRTADGRTQKKVRVFDTAEKAQCFADGVWFVVAELENQ